MRDKTRDELKPWAINCFDGEKRLDLKRINQEFHLKLMLYGNVEFNLERPTENP